MLKYVVLFLIAGIVLLYSYLSDPCNNQFKTDFSNKYPSYKILSFSPGEQASDGVTAVAGGGSIHCHISYQKPDSEQVFEDTWLYQNLGDGWNFSRIVATIETNEE